MESSQENLSTVGQQVSNIRLWCGKCDTECDYMGVDPHKILAFVCMKCHTFNEVDDEQEGERYWLYASSDKGTITADVIDGEVWRPAPLAKYHAGKKVEQFAKDWGAKRLFIFRHSKEE